jgi:cell wall-associated NlpC family hydrolase
MNTLLPSRPALLSVALIPLALLVFIAVSAAGAVAGQGLDQQDAACHLPVQPGLPEAGGRLTGSQIANAHTIYTVGLALRVPAPGETIAIATALQESGLQNLPHGDRDSLGLFQQRPSQGWGTPTQLLNPIYAATQFYTRLLHVPGWQTMPLTAAAQAVQHSAFPGAYARWTALAGRLVAGFGGTPGAGLCPAEHGNGDPITGSVDASTYRIPPGVPAPIVTVIRFALAQLGKPYRWGATGADAWDCSSLTQAAYATIGIRLGRTTYTQATQGRPVYRLADLRPGDLLFTPGTPTHPGHVALYLGRNLLIEAPRTGRPVRITALAGYWQHNISIARRFTS